MKGMEVVFDICQGKSVTPFTLALWSELYSKVYTWCTRPEEKKKEELYYKTADYYTSKAAAEEVELRGKNDEYLLRDYLKRYQNYTNATKKLTKIFAYMHRYWIPGIQQQGERDIRDMYIMSIAKWREKTYTPLRQRLLAALLALVTQDRNGEKVDKSILSNMVQAYVELGVNEEQPVLFYKKEFQEPFIEDTRAYYLKESTAFLAQNSTSAYMAKAEERLAQEETLAQSYLHATSKPEVVKAVEDSLIEKHNQVLQDEFQNWLRDDKMDDMRRFFGLLSRIPNGLTRSADTLKQWLTQVGQATVKEQSKALDTKAALKDSVTLIVALLDLHKKYTKILKDCFGDHKLFVQAMDEACTVFINMSVGQKKGAKGEGEATFTMAEVLNFYVDHLLKGGEKLSEDALEEKLDQIVRLFTYFDDKDMFYAAFRRSLSKRLLGKKFNEDAERSFIGKLKARAGDVFTKKLEGMFNDIKVSQEREATFKDYCESLDSKPAVETTVAVLNNLYWPLNKQTDLSLPKDMVPAKELFEKWYNTTTEKRKLTWLYNLGDVTVAHQFLDEKKKLKKVELVVSPIQAAILVLFNEAGEFKYKEVREQIGATEELSKYSIAPLIFTKTRVLANKGSDGTGKQLAQGAKPSASDIEDEDVLKLVGMRGVATRRIPFPPGLGLVAGERPVEPVMEERQMKIDLALVRVMKARNVLDMQNLIGESTKQLMKYFRPDPRMMKKRIESLVERGFMRRDESDQRQLHYCA